jgi:hypothetical protein
MGNNVDLMRMLGLPKEVVINGKIINLENQFRDYDIDDSDTNPEDGVWNITVSGYDNDNETEWVAALKVKVSAEITIEPK